MFDRLRRDHETFPKMTYSLRPPTVRARRAFFLKILPCVVVVSLRYSLEFWTTGSSELQTSCLATELPLVLNDHRKTTAAWK